MSVRKPKPRGKRIKVIAYEGVERRSPDFEQRVKERRAFTGMQGRRKTSFRELLEKDIGRAVPKGKLDEFEKKRLDHLVFFNPNPKMRVVLRRTNGKIFVSTERRIGIERRREERRSNTGKRIEKI